MKRREALTFDTRGVQSQQIHYFMKKFIMLGASLVMLLVATACMSSAAKMQKNEAGTVKSNEFATVEGLIGIDCPNAVIADAGLVAGEKMNIPTTTLVSSSTKKEAATEIKTNATGGAGIMPEETAIISNNKQTVATKLVVEKNNNSCSRTNCIAKNTAVIAGGNYS